MGPSTRAIDRVASQQGGALIVVLLATTLLLALGTMLALTTATETAVAAHHRDGIEALHAAGAGLGWAAHDLARAADWDAVLAGTHSSTWWDGAPGIRSAADGSSIDLVALTNELRCGSALVCSDAAMDEVTAARPWGRNNPRWQIFAHGRAARLPGVDSRAYVVVWVGDDAAETDGDPLRDGGEPEEAGAGSPMNPGRGVLQLIVHAYGPGAAVRTVEASLARAEGRSGLRLLSWRLSR